MYILAPPHLGHHLQAGNPTCSHPPPCWPSAPAPTATILHQTPITCLDYTTKTAKLIAFTRAPHFAGLAATTTRTHSGRLLHHVTGEQQKVATIRFERNPDHPLLHSSQKGPRIRRQSPSRRRPATKDPLLPHLRHPKEGINALLHTSTIFDITYPPSSPWPPAITCTFTLPSITFTLPPSAAPNTTGLPLLVAPSAVAPPPLGFRPIIGGTPPPRDSPPMKWIRTGGKEPWRTAGQRFEFRKRENGRRERGHMYSSKIYNQ